MTKTPGTIQVVVGGQYGSEGKGAVCDYLSRTHTAVGVRVAGPNAGHTVIDQWSGNAVALRHLPVSAYNGADTHTAVIAAGSEVDVEVLFDEMADLRASGRTDLRVLVDKQATVLLDEHKAEEARRSFSTGSTFKGIGAARAARAMRKAPLVGDLDESELPDDVTVTDTVAFLRERLWAGQNVQIEGTQGYGLGLHAGEYPYSTSSDCRATDFLAMAGLDPFQFPVEVWVVLRTYPIRIAGNSGDLRYETSWEAIGQEAELTTVTKKERRVGEWDLALARAAVEANGGETCKVALTFLDYWYPAVYGEREWGALSYVEQQAVQTLERKLGTEIALLGTGPDTAIQPGY